MKGFCSYHELRISHADAGKIIAGRKAEFKASAIAREIEDGGMIDAVGLFPYDPAMRLADSVLAYGKRKGLVHFNREKNIWVKGPKA